MNDDGNSQLGSVALIRGGGGYDIKGKISYRCRGSLYTDVLRKKKERNISKTIIYLAIYAMPTNKSVNQSK